MRWATACLLSVTILVGPASAEVRFANIFNDNMVLQQKKPIHVWGWADPGRTGTVTLTEDRGKITENYDARTAGWETERGRARTLERARREFEEKRIGRWRREVERAKWQGRKPPRMPEFRPPRDPRKGHSEPVGVFDLAGCGNPETPVERSCVLGGYAIIRDTLTRYADGDPRT